MDLPIFDHDKPVVIDDKVREEVSVTEIGPSGVIAAYLEATGRFSAKEIADRVGESPEWLFGIRVKPGYKLQYTQALKEIVRKSCEGADDFGDLLDREIADSIATLVEIRDNVFNSANARLKASDAILSRAPKAPKPQQLVEQQHTVIHIPLAQLDGIKKGLVEEGQQDLIDLIEGEDFEEVGGAEQPLLEAPREAQVVEFD